MRHMTRDELQTERDAAMRERDILALALQVKLRVKVHKVQQITHDSHQAILRDRDLVRQPVIK